MVKVNKSEKNKSKLNLVSNKSLKHNKIKLNKKKLASHVRLTINNASDLDLTVNSTNNNSTNKPKNNHVGLATDGNRNKSARQVNNNNKSFSKLFRKSRTKREAKQNIEKNDFKSQDKVNEKSRDDSKSQDVNEKITSNDVPNKSIPQKKAKMSNVEISGKFVSRIPWEKRLVPVTNHVNVTNGTHKIENETCSVAIPKSKRKTYENGWVVEDMSENSNEQDDSSDSDRDSYLDKFFEDDLEMSESKPEPKSKKKLPTSIKNSMLRLPNSSGAAKPQKSMLLITSPPEPTELVADSTDEEQNVVKSKRKCQRNKLKEHSGNEMVRFVGDTNGDDDFTTDSEYDPSWNAMSDDDYEGMDDNEYIEYSAEEVETESDENSTEFESSEFEITESDEGESFYDECMSDEGTYNSEDDEDYDPGVNDDLYIQRGNAKIYDINDNNISFNSDEGAQIFEIPMTEQEITTDNESCPDLVPISSVPQSANVSINSSVVNDLLKDSENEMNSESDDDIFSQISPKQIDGSPVQPTVVNESDEEYCASDEKSQFYNSPVTSHLVLLHLKDVIYVHGNFKATLIHGSAKSFGYEYKLNKPVELYSPACDSLLYIEPCDSDKLVKFNPKKIEEYFGQDVINEITKGLACSTRQAIMLLEYHESKRVESIRLYMRDEIFPVIKETKLSSSFHLSEIRLSTNFIFPDNVHYSGYRKLEAEATWDAIPMHSSSKILVIGGKNVGKSSLLKYLINSNINRLSKILFIDFDIGQPEMYVPQTISATIVDFPILGSGCFHKVQPVKIVLFGDISVATEQIKYIQACNKLIQYCKSNEELAGIPWVINTMGYNKGLGDEIVAAFIKFLKPTDVVQINSSRNADNFSNMFTPEYTNQYQFNIFTEELKSYTEVCSYNLIAIEAFTQMYKRNAKGLLSAKDKRLLMILAHLGDILDVSGAKWLTDAEVKKIQLNDLHVFTTYSLDKFGCTASLLKMALDMTFVYLCNKNNDTSTDATADCIGIGLVRHLDTTLENLYLITAVPDDNLELVNALALTNITIAKALLEKQSIMVKGEIKYLGKSNDFVGTRQVKPQTYRPDTTINTQSNFSKE